MLRRLPRSPLFPYTTLFRSLQLSMRLVHDLVAFCAPYEFEDVVAEVTAADRVEARSEEHTSELQSHSELVCRLLLEKKIEQSNGCVFLFRSFGTNDGGDVVK